jgi:hypothetical protein
MFFLCCRKVVEELETKCLKATNHLANDQLTYETPSDYDPLSVNMGQMIVYRFTIRDVATYHRGVFHVTHHVTQGLFS